MSPFAPAACLPARRHPGPRLLLVLLLSMVMAPAARATPVDLADVLQGIESRGGASAAKVAEIAAALRAGEFDRAVGLAQRLRDAAPGNVDHELLLALARVGGERLGAAQAQIRALDETAPEAGDRLRTVLARYLLSRGRSYPALVFLADARTPEGERELMRMRAQVLMAAQRVEPAKAAQLALLKRDPDDTRALLDMARLHLLEHQPARALAYTARAAQLGAGGDAFALVSANAHLLAADLAAADAAFARIESGPTAMLAAFNRALIAHLRGEPAKAVARYRQLDPSRIPLGDPRPGAVLAALEAGDVATARQALAGAVPAADPLHALLESALAAAQGDLAAADRALRRAAALFVDVVLPGFEARRYLGSRPAAAAADAALRAYLYRLGYFRVAALRPVPGGDRPPAPAFSLLGKARAHWKAGMDAEALQVYGELRRAYPELLAPLVESADVHFFRGDHESAIRLYEQAVRAHPQLHALRLQLGDLLSTAGRPRAAMKVYEAITDRDPDNADARARIASVLFDKRSLPGDALPHAQRAHGVRPGDAQITALLGRIHHALGEPGKGFELLREALEQSGGRDPQIFAHLGQVLLALRRNDEARRALEHALNSGAELEDAAAVEQAYLRLAGLDAG